MTTPLKNDEPKVNDPTISSSSVTTGYPEGTHPPRPPEASNPTITYKDNPDKPDPSTVAQIAIIED